MTDELIELEFAHMELDKALRENKDEEYMDPTFDEWDKETNEEDQFDPYEYEISDHVPEDNSEEEWEDIEFEGEPTHLPLPTQPDRGV